MPLRESWECLAVERILPPEERNCDQTVNNCSQFARFGILGTVHKVLHPVHPDVPQESDSPPNIQKSLQFVDSRCRCKTSRCKIKILNKEKNVIFLFWIFTIYNPFFIDCIGRLNVMVFNMIKQFP